MKLVIGGLDPWQRGDTGAAPGGPKIHQHHFAFHGGEIHLGPIKCGEGDLQSAADDGRGEHPFEFCKHLRFPPGIGMPGELLPSLCDDAFGLGHVYLLLGFHETVNPVPEIFPEGSQVAIRASGEKGMLFFQNSHRPILVLDPDVALEEKPQSLLEFTGVGSGNKVFIHPCQSGQRPFPVPDVVAVGHEDLLQSLHVVSG